MLPFNQNSLPLFHSVNPPCATQPNKNIHPWRQTPQQKKKRSMKALTRTPMQEKQNEWGIAEPMSKMGKTPDHQSKTLDKSTHQPDTNSKKKQMAKEPHCQNQEPQAWHLSPDKLQKKRARQQKARTLTFATGHRRPATFSNKPGYRTLNILSLNPDNFISTTRKDDIIHELTKQKIHIASIQETHAVRYVIPKKWISYYNISSQKNQQQEP